MPSRIKLRRVSTSTPDEDQAEHVVNSADSAASPVLTGHSGVRPINISKIEARLDKLLASPEAYSPEKVYYLDTGSPDMNAALGSRDLGLVYGKLIELSGLEHGGKTALGLILGGMAQRDGAVMGYLDFERSADKPWSVDLGVDYDNVLLLQAKLIPNKNPELPPRLQSAEDLWERMETAFHVFHRKGFEKQYWLVDSIAMIHPAKAIEAGASKQSMRTRMERSIFLADNLPILAGLAANYNAMVVLINQLRMKQGMVFGDPFKEVGGQALAHALAVRARVSRAKGVKIQGLASVVRNKKNKAGSGSVERCEAGFKIRRKTKPPEVEFTSVEEVKGLGKEEE